MIHHGDAIEVMAQMAENSVDAIVTDPPYGLEFMGKEWDRLGGDVRQPGDATFHKSGSGPHDRSTVRYGYGVPSRVMQDWHYQWAREAFRIAKPGAYLLAFGGTRTVHRLASAIEDAGWEIRDELIWVYASGFPKSLDVSKALDKAAGAERERLGAGPYDARRPASRRVEDGGESVDWHYGDGQSLTAPATDLAKQWEGWGTALKPAHEPIVMARKPLVGSVAANVTRYGVGALNIGATRIGTDGGHEGAGPGPRGEIFDQRPGSPDAGLNGARAQPVPGLGRWPSNLLLSDAELFDVANPGVVGSGAVTTSGDKAFSRRDSDRHWEGGAFGDDPTPYPGDSGGYSRFFIVPKSARADREPVLRGQLAAVEGQASIQHGGAMERWPDGHLEPRKTPLPLRENAHPTVKPTDLMRHLIRLVTPPGGTVLDCFLGSGSTALACEMEGFAWIGIEKEAEYVAIAEARLNGVQRGLGLDVPAPTRTRSLPSDGKLAELGKTYKSHATYSGGWGWEDSQNDD